MVPTLLTPRLELRPFSPADVPTLHTLMNDPRIADYTLNIPHPLPPQFALQWTHQMLEKAASSPFVPWAIWLRPLEAEAEGTMIGHIHLGFDLRHKKGGLGYWLGSEHRGQGHMTEAVAAVVRHAFEGLELYRIEANHYPRNPASGRVLEKVGFVREGLARGYLWKDGVPEDVVQYAILRTDPLEGEAHGA